MHLILALIVFGFFIVMRRGSKYAGGYSALQEVAPVTL
jgi:flagellar biogenesis protein FliO